MDVLSLHSSSCLAHCRISASRVVLQQNFVATPRLKYANLKEKQGTSSKSRLVLTELRAQSSGTMNPDKSATISGVEEQSKDNQLVFVAGATGKVGSRTVRELLKLGFRVRACTRSLQKGEALLESVTKLKLDSQDANSSVPSRSTVKKKIEIVLCDLEKPDEIRPAISNAGVVVCCIGASEKEFFDVTGPYRIDYQATKNLIDAATAANVSHLILLTSLGTSKVGFPAAVLNLFWGVLVWKRKAEEALINSGLPYSIVRPGGMERPTDAYKETHNLVLSSKDMRFGGQVSNLQVAELIACMVNNRELSINKIIEVIAETTAPILPTEQLLAKISSEESVVQRPSLKGVKTASVLSSVKQDPSESALPVAEKVELQLGLEKCQPLSPYTMYEDLKPPASPSPTTKC